MKKVFIIALMACLVLGAAFADGLKVGAQGGYGSFVAGFVDEDDAASYLITSQNGFYGAASLEFDATEALGLKAEFGVLVPSKAYLTVRNGKDDKPETEEMPDGTIDFKPIFNGYLGLQFNAELAKTLSFTVGAGLDLFFAGEGDDFNLGIGAGAEVISSFNVSDNFSLNVGGKFGYYFFNTNEDFKESPIPGTKIVTFGWKAFAGATINL